jgi:ribonuclease HI
VHVWCVSWTISRICGTKRGVEIDPNKVESIRKLAELTCKRDMQKLLGKVN